MVANLSALLLALTPQHLPSPYNLLKKMLGCLEHQVLTGKMAQYSGKSKSVSLISQSSTGRTYYLVVEPSSSKGMEIIDDMERMLYYNPAKRMLTIEDRRQDLTTEDQAKLIKQNYRLYISEGPHIAGRDTWTLYLEAMRQPLDSRRFLVDRSTGMALRSESVNNGAVNLRFEFESIAFPAKVAEPSPQQLFSKTKSIRDHRKPSLDRNHAAAQLGFIPIIPVKVPLGMVVREMQVITVMDKPVLAIRMTDGLAWATLYEYKTAETSADEMVGGKRAGLLTLVVRGDVPEAAKTLIQEVFAAQAK